MLSRDTPKWTAELLRRSKTSLIELWSHGLLKIYIPLLRGLHIELSKHNLKQWKLLCKYPLVLAEQMETLEIAYDLDYMHLDDSGLPHVPQFEFLS